MVIAIDGPAGSGKSTLARLLAERLAAPDGRRFTYLNSGNFYRALTLGCLARGIDPLDAEKAAAFAGEARLECRGGRLFLDGEDVEDRLHTDEIDRYVASLSAFVPVRHAVNDRLRRVAREGEGRGGEGGGPLNAVVEGRDMTTVVFPDAEFRFFLDARPEARAQRRFDQGVSRMGLDEIREAILRRDEIDRNKEEGSLAVAPGVVYLDSSLLTIEQVYEKVREIIQGKGKGRNMALTDKEHEEKLTEGKLTGEKHPGGGYPRGERPEKAPRGGGGERPAKAAPRAPAGVSVEEAGAEVQSQLQEEYLKHLERLEVGRLVDGCVVQVTPSHVFVNIGYKSEGRIPLSEFEETPKEGDTVQAVLVSKEDQNGEVVLSREKAGMKIFWKNLRAAMQNRSGVDIVIEKIVRGGFDVNLGSGVHGFLPLSQTDLFRVEEPEKYVGMKAQAVVERIYADNKLNIVVSRRNWLTEEMDRKRNAFLAANGVGDDVTGVVKSTTSFGAFVDLGGFDGLLHIKDMSWGHADKAKDFVRKGQELRLKIVRVDEDGRRINLSLKHLTEDPWVHFEDKYHVNDIVKGKVTKLTDFGAFLEIETGIEGLVHISEFSWVKRFQKAKDFLQKGDTVECMILGYDIQAGKVSLGIRQATPNPWETIEERYPVGTRLTKKVTKVTNTAAFIELDDGIEGCLRAEDMSWTRKIEHLGSKIHAGDEIETVVIVVDRRARNIRLGIKQLTENPWRKFSAAYKPGDIVEGTVSAVAEFGIFVSVPGQDVEGLVHKSNLTMDRDEDPDEARKKYKVGDAVTATVLEILPDKQKLTFSVRDYQKKIQREEISRYTANEAGDATHTLGDLLKSKSRDTGKGEKESPEEPQEPEKEAP